MAGMGTMTATQIGKIVLTEGAKEASEPKRITGMALRGESEKAILVGEKGGSFECWIPKSQMTEVHRWTRIGERTGREFPMIDFTVPGWLAVEKML